MRPPLTLNVLSNGPMYNKTRDALQKFMMQKKKQLVPRTRKLETEKKRNQIHCQFHQRKLLLSANQLLTSTCNRYRIRK